MSDFRSEFSKECDTLLRCPGQDAAGATPDQELLLVFSTASPKPATMRRTGGQWSNTIYQGNPVTGTLVTKTVSGWKNNSAPDVGVAPDENANRVVTEFEAKNETGTIGREEKIGGVIVSRTWGERYKARSGELVEKSNEQRGSATLTTIRTGYPDDDSASPAERGRLKSIQHPDGTFTLHRHTISGVSPRIETSLGSVPANISGVSPRIETFHSVNSP